MSENQDDANNNQQSEVSKLSRPTSVNKFFNSIQINPKLCHLQAKIKPNPFDKNTKLTLKTHNNLLFGNGWINNSKLKFESKDEKTKLSLSMKPSTGKIRNEKTYIKQNQRDNNEDYVDPMKAKSGKQNDSDIDLNLSTTYDNLKIGIKAKQKGQLQLKVNQSCYLIKDRLAINYEHLWHYKKQIDTNKSSLQFVLENQISKQVYKKENEDALKFRKNQTLMKCKIGNSIDPEIKFVTLNHFGRIERVHQKSQLDKPNETQNKQVVQMKLFLQNKIWSSSKTQNKYNFKSTIQNEHIQKKQTFKIQSHLTERGLQNFQAKYLSKYFSMFIFGASHSLYWNHNNKKWVNKWELYFQREKIKNIGNIGLSLNTKFGGLRVKRGKGNVKFELTVSKKWGDWDKWPSLGLKINANL